MSAFLVGGSAFRRVYRNEAREVLGVVPTTRSEWFERYATALEEFRWFQARAWAEPALVRFELTRWWAVASEAAAVLGLRVPRWMRDAAALEPAGRVG